MKRSTLVMVLCLVLAVAMGVGSTMAYLQDTDEDVNVMTLGSVYITQNEQERNADGELVPFTPNKPVYPAVYKGSVIEYANEADWPVPGDPAWKVVEENPEVVDKFITVTNTGKSDAFVRTLVAFEVGENAVNDPYMHLVCNGNSEGTNWNYYWLQDENGGDYHYVIEEGENAGTYAILVFTHKVALKPGETTQPSVKQIYLDKEATNEVVEAYGEDFKILALSQAVQTQGFADAETALNTAFEAVTPAKVAEWFGGDFGKDNVGTPGDKWPNNNPPIIPDDATVVTNIDELKAALANKDKLIYVDEGSYDFGGKYSIPEGTTIFGMDNDRVEFKGTLTSTLKNLTFENIRFAGSDALRWAYPSGTLTFKNCEFEPTSVYAVHFDTTNADVLFEDCRIIGWAAMGSGSGHLTFKNCEVIGDGWYGVLRCFVDADVIDCTFDVDNVNTTDVYQDGLHAVGSTINVVNCTNVNGTMQDLVNVSNDGVINIQ